MMAQGIYFLYTFKLMNPVRGIETYQMILARIADWAFKLMNPVRGIETMLF